MSEQDNDVPFEPIFSKRAKLMPKRSAEDLKAAKELLQKLEEERKAEEEATLSKKAAKELLQKLKEERKAEEEATLSKKGKKKKSSKTAENLDDLTVDSVVLSAAAKRRLKKMRDEGKRELEIIEAENAKILSIDTSELSLTEEEPNIPEEEKTIYLTVNYFNKYKRFKYYENEKFLKVFQDVADFFELNPAEILLCLKDRNIAMSDTPKSLGLTEFDILECLPYKISETDGSISDDNCVKIIFQSNDTKTKVDMTVNKLEKMSCLMERYSKKRCLPLNELTFEFDGDKLLGNETPAELDMESGSCVDVTVFVPVAECSYSKDIEPEFRIEDFLDYDSDSNGSDIVVLN